MNKHAYLIMAYNNWKVLQKQIELLDYPENDIYLTVDEKSEDFDPEMLPRCEHAGLFLMERMKIFWADFSQIEPVLKMLHRAFENEKENSFHYTYFHIFCGTTLPLKSQKYIHEFCDGSGKEFIAIVPRELWYSTRRVKYYWYFLKNKHYKRHKSLKALTELLARLQRIIGVNRLKNYDGIIYNGWDWASISGDFAKYLLSNEDFIRKTFDKTMCPSELWMQTMAYNSPFKERLYDEADLKNGSMRYIDWKRGRPYIWGRDDGDFENLMESPYLFARKFDEKYFDIVEKIYSTLHE